MRRITTYEYPEPDGVVRLRKIRFEPKAFRMEARKRTDCRWVPSLAHFEAKYPRARDLFASLLYNLPMLLADPPRVALTEGEKDAAALTGVGLPSLSHWQGAQNFTALQAERFRGYRGRVFIFADADAAGAACAVRRYDLLLSVGIAPSRLRLIVPAKGHEDAADHLQAGHSLREFRRWPLDAMREFAATAPPPTQRGGDYDTGASLHGWHPAKGGRR